MSAVEKIHKRMAEVGFVLDGAFVRTGEFRDALAEAWAEGARAADPNLDPDEVDDANPYKEAP